MKAAVANYRYATVCLRIETTSGTIIYLTRYTRDLTMNGHTYLSAGTYDFSAYTAGTGLSSSMVDLEGIAGMAGISYDALASGLFDNARCYLFKTTWKTPIEDEEPITASILGKTTLKDDKYVIEEMSLIDVLNQSVGETYTVTCPKTFGGTEFAGCKKVVPDSTGTLTGVTSSSVFTDNTRTEADDWYGNGTIEFTSGANAGLGPKELKSYTLAGVITTFEPFHYLPEVGDTYTMKPGCRKRQNEDCRDKWDNVVNFGGFIHIPLGSVYATVGTK